MSTKDPTFTYFTYLFFFIYLPMKDHVKHQRRSFLQQQKAANQDLFYPLTVPISNTVMPFLRTQMPCFLLKYPKTYAIQGEYTVLSAVNLEK